MTAILIMTLLTITILTQISHPVSFIFAMILLTVNIAMLSSFSMTMFWYSYTLILIFLGGMLILFLYIASIAPNAMFPKIKIINLSCMLMLVFTLTLFINDKTWPEMVLSNNMQSPMSTLSKLYAQNSMITIFLIMYLLLTLLVVVKITNFKSGPLRSE